MHELAKQILLVGRQFNLFSSSISASDIEMVLDKCLMEDKRDDMFHRRLTE